MDIGHTLGPLVSGLVALYFGFDKAFIGAALVLIAASFVFLFLIKVLQRNKAINQQ
jgi:hypothetical protein